MKNKIILLSAFAILAMVVIPYSIYSDPNGGPPYVDAQKYVDPSEVHCIEATVTLNVAGKGEPLFHHFPIDVMLIMDRSGSMLNDPISDAKIAAKTFVAQLNSSSDQSGLVSFNETATIDQGLTNDMNAVNNSIDALEARGWTNIGDAIYNATEEILSNGRNDVIWAEILLSDGIPNRPFNDNTHSYQKDKQYALNASIYASQQDIVIYTIGLGTSVDSTTLQQIADNTGGNYYYAPTSADLADIYLQIAEELFNIAGTNVVVTDLLPNYVSYVSGLPGECTHNAGNITCVLGDMNINDTFAIIFNVSLNQLDNNRVNVYPDSGVTYSDYLGGSKFAEFPETNVTVTGYPGAEEICDGIDNDCDGQIDEDLTRSCGSGICEGTQTCTAGVWGDCSSSGIECSRTSYCDTPSQCDGHAMYAVCDVDGICGSENNRVDGDDSKCDDEDCGTCCICSSGSRNYDEIQDLDCPSTSCPDACDIDINLFTWDYADDVPNYCQALDICTSNDCSYSHECHDDDPFDGVNGNTCGAECDQNSDCQNECVNGVRYYGGSCDLVSTCECSYSTEDCDLQDGCHPYDTGCEDRDYFCDPAICDYTYSNRNTDSYDSFVNYCSGDTVREHRQFHDLYCDSNCIDHLSWVDDQLVENCDVSDGWVDTGSLKWVDDTECTEKEQKEQVYSDYYCSESPSVACYHTNASTQWVDTGNTRNKAEGTECGEFRDCPSDQCIGFFAEFYPDDGHDTCDGSGNCIVYSCEMEDSYCTDNDNGDGVNVFMCGAECDQNSDCGNKCVGEVRYYNGNCDLVSTCECSYSTENCNALDGWYDTSSWVYSDCERCKNQEYRDYSCDPAGCSFSVTDTRELCENINEGQVCDTGNYECISDCSRGQEEYTCQTGECLFNRWINQEDCSPYSCSGGACNGCSLLCGAECLDDMGCAQSTTKCDYFQRKYCTRDEYGSCIGCFCLEDPWVCGGIDDTDYCNNCDHCGDHECNCGETIETCLMDCLGIVPKVCVWGRDIILNGINILDYRAGQYAFTGEQIKFNVTVRDPRGADNIGFVMIYVDGQPQALCNPIDYNESCDGLGPFDPLTDKAFKCTYTVEPTIYEWHIVTIEAITSTPENITITHSEEWFFNPAISLDVRTNDDQPVQFEDGGPGDTVHSLNHIKVRNVGEGGINLWMYIAGTDLYGEDAVKCPYTNKIDIEDWMQFQAWTGTITGEWTYMSEYDENDGCRLFGTCYGGFPIPDDPPLGNVLTNDGILEMKFKLTYPVPCIGTFDEGSIIIIGKPI